MHTYHIPIFIVIKELTYLFNNKTFNLGKLGQSTFFARAHEMLSKKKIIRETVFARTFCPSTKVTPCPSLPGLPV